MAYSDHLHECPRCRKRWPHELLVVGLRENSGHRFALDMLFFADTTVRLPGEFLGEDAGLDGL